LHEGLDGLFSGTRKQEIRNRDPDGIRIYASDPLGS